MLNLYCLYFDSIGGGEKKSHPDMFQRMKSSNWSKIIHGPNCIRSPPPGDIKTILGKKKRTCGFRPVTLLTNKSRFRKEPLCSGSVEPPHT